MTSIRPWNTKQKTKSNISKFQTRTHTDIRNLTLAIRQTRNSKQHRHKDAHGSRLQRSGNTLVLFRPHIHSCTISSRLIAEPRFDSGPRAVVSTSVRVWGTLSVSKRQTIVATSLRASGRASLLAHGCPVTPFCSHCPSPPVPARPRPCPFACLLLHHPRPACPLWGQAEPSSSGFVVWQPCVLTGGHYRICPNSSSSVPNAATECSGM